MYCYATNKKNRMTVYLCLGAYAYDSFVNRNAEILSNFLILIFGFCIFGHCQVSLGVL